MSKNYYDFCTLSFLFSTQLNYANATVSADGDNDLGANDNSNKDVSAESQEGNSSSVVLLHPIDAYVNG